MVVAMMWPLTVPTVGAIARSSFRGWRNRLGAVCLATVTILWLAVGLAGALLAQALSGQSGSFAWQLTFIALALVAFGSARRSRLLETCLRLPALAPGGRRGVETAVRAGVLTWRRCAAAVRPCDASDDRGAQPWPSWFRRRWPLGGRPGTPGHGGIRCRSCSSPQRAPGSQSLLSSAAGSAMDDVIAEVDLLIQDGSVSLADMGVTGGAAEKETKELKLPG